VFLALTGQPNPDPQSSASPDEDDYPAHEGSTT
jgi:hypothetical protein